MIEKVQGNLLKADAEALVADSEDYNGKKCE